MMTTVPVNLDLWFIWQSAVHTPSDQTQQWFHVEDAHSLFAASGNAVEQAGDS